MLYGLKRRARVTIATAVIATSAMSMISACSSGSSHDSKSTSGNSTVTPSKDYSLLEQYGFTPLANSVQNFACSDSSYADAVKNGLTIGIYNDAPYTYLDNSQQPSGIDWDIDKAVMSYIGVAKYKAVVVDSAAAIPALESKRIDVIGVNYHENPDRLKQIAFTTPAWFYVGVIIIQKDNPKHITSWEDLVKPGVTVAAQAGSDGEAQIESHGGKPVIYQDTATMYQALEQGRQDAGTGDAAQLAVYLKSHPDSKLAYVHGLSGPFGEATSYARYGLRKQDCTLDYAWSAALAELRAEGVIGKILQKWGLDPVDNVTRPQG